MIVDWRFKDDSHFRIKWRSDLSAHALQLQAGAISTNQQSTIENQQSKSEAHELSSIFITTRRTAQKKK